jgi:hypothetical protein
MLPDLMITLEKITALASMNFPAVTSTVGGSVIFTPASLRA